MNHPLEGIVRFRAPAGELSNSDRARLCYLLAETLRVHAAKLAKDLAELHDIPEEKRQLAHRFVLCAGWADELYWCAHYHLTGVIYPRQTLKTGELPVDRDLELYCRTFVGWSMLCGSTNEWQKALDLLYAKTHGDKQDKVLLEMLQADLKRLGFWEFRHESDFKFWWNGTANVAEFMKQKSVETSGWMMARARSYHLTPDPEQTWREDDSRRSPPEQIGLVADWLLDLFLDEPGLRYLKTSTGFRAPEEHKGVASFPNFEAIRLLQVKITEHASFLGFLVNIHNLTAHLELIRTKDEKLRTYISNQERFIRWETDKSHLRIHVLRQWNSITPLLFRSTGQTAVGGGCFIKIQVPETDKQMGLVLDPGFDYTENFQRQGLGIDEITHVFVTHDHYDHISSLGPLLNLLHAHRNDEERPRVDFYLSRGALSAYASAIHDFKWVGKVVPVTKDDSLRDVHHHLTCPDGVKILVTPTPTRHGHESGFGKGVGFKLDVRFHELDANLKIGITSDTAWFDPDDNPQDEPDKPRKKQDLGELFEDVHILLAHVGSLRTAELKDSGYYRTHLGMRGVYRLLEKAKDCEVVLLTEFGEECEGHREWFANELESYFHRNAHRDFRCLPTDHTFALSARFEPSRWHYRIGAGVQQGLQPLDEFRVGENTEEGLHLGKVLKKR